MIAESNILGLCAEIDARLAREDVRVEDVSARLRLLRPLEKEVGSLSQLPSVPHSAAGRIATSLWYKTHPEEADIEGLLYLLLDESPLVRFVATDAILLTLKSPHKSWLDVRFAYTAKQVISERREQEASPMIAHQLDQISESIGPVVRPRKKQRAKVILNPYVAGLPVYGRERFFGREAILDLIKNYVRKTEGVKSILLYGARRTGKTSVLYQIRNGALGSGVLPVYLDMQALAGTDLQDFLRALLLNTLDAVRERKQIHTGELPPLKDQVVTFPVMQKFFRSLLSELGDTSLLLMLDEYEVLGNYLSNSNLARQIQSLLEIESQLFAIFAGSQKLEALKEKHKRFLFLLDNAKYIKISFLKRDEALQLITGPSQGKLRFAPGVPECILDYTAGHPFYTQLLCQTIFDNVKASGTAERQDVEDAVRQFLQDPSPHLILTWNSMEVEQKVAGSTLAALQDTRESFIEPFQILKKLSEEEYPIKISVGEVQAALNALRDIDWVERKEKGSSYRFSMELVRSWIVENRSIWELAEQQREGLLSKVAGFWPQRFAWLVDFVIFPIIFVAVLVALLYTSLGAGWLILIMLGVPLFYFVVPILLKRSTLGMRLFHLRVVSAKALPLKPRQALIYGFVQSLRFLFMASLIVLVCQIVLNTLDNIVLPFLSILAVAAIVGEGLDAVSILFGQKRQGVYDKFMRALIVPASAIKE
jgi:uncharacterized RDD family membrane protein YckC